MSAVVGLGTLICKVTVRTIRENLIRQRFAHNSRMRRAAQGLANIMSSTNRTVPSPFYDFDTGVPVILHSRVKEVWNRS